MGTKFTVYDHGVSPAKAQGLVEKACMRQELAAVCYVSAASRFLSLLASQPWACSPPPKLVSVYSSYVRIAKFSCIYCFSRPSLISSSLFPMPPC